MKQPVCLVSLVVLVVLVAVVRGEPCSGSNVCSNGGVCQRTGQQDTDFICKCPRTHCGATCQTSFTACDTNPCQNNGTCSKNLYDTNSCDAVCDCVDVFCGNTCTEDQCSGVTCQNSGNCTSCRECRHSIEHVLGLIRLYRRYQGFKSRLGKIGRRFRQSGDDDGDDDDGMSELDDDEQSKVRRAGCGNTCTKDERACKCEAYESWSNPRPCPKVFCECPTTHCGASCELTSACSSSPCQNGATCYPDPRVDKCETEFVCRCPRRFSGSTCQTDLGSTSSGGGDGSCFHGDSMVQVKGVGVRPMKVISVGDEVLTVDDQFKPVYQPVLLIGHADPHLTSPFITLTTGTGYRLTMTPGHFLYKLDENMRPVYIQARDLVVGDLVVVVGDEMKDEVDDLKADLVTGIEVGVKTGVYDVLVASGHLVVDGVVATSYSDAVTPGVGHNAAWIIRQLGVRVTSWMPFGDHKTGQPAWLHALEVITYPLIR